jgi:sugar phosphate isomerase/epimerase
MSVEITMLSAMAGADFATALDRHVAWGLHVLDLKDGIFGKGLLDLTDEEAARAAAMIRERGLRVHCLSSGLFHADVERGREAFLAGMDERVERLMELAQVLQPEVVRLLAATTSRRAELTDAVADVQARHPWLVEGYQRAIDRISAGGFMATLENEVGGCILAGPAEVRRLFELIDRPGKVMFTWDVQNMWQCGTWPSVQVYERVADLTGYVHLKGGQSLEPGGPLVYRSRLEDSSYDVAGIVRAVVTSGRVPVICLNPPHGKPGPGYDDSDRVERDVAFLRTLIGGAS